MGWKNGYYYKNHKVNGRVVTEYHGSGTLAELQAVLDQQEQAAKRAERAEIEFMQAQDKADGELLTQAQTMAKAALLAAGYYQHKGQWRRSGNK